MQGFAPFQFAPLYFFGPGQQPAFYEPVAEESAVQPAPYEFLAEESAAAPLANGSNSGALQVADGDESREATERGSESLTSEEDSAEEDAEDPLVGAKSERVIQSLNCQIGLALVASIVVPNMILIAFFSHLGLDEEHAALGLPLFNWLAEFEEGTRLLYGGACIGFAISLGVLYYLFDLVKCVTIIQVFCGLLLVVVSGAGAIFMALEYPGLPLGLVVALVPLAVSAIRLKGPQIESGQFYCCFATTTAACGIIILSLFLAWISYTSDWWNQATKEQLVNATSPIYNTIYARPLDYTADCSSQRNLTMYNESEAEGINDSCEVAALVWTLVWWCPVFVSMANFVATAMVCSMFLVNVPTDKKTVVPPTQIKLVVAGLAALFMCIFSGAAFYGASPKELSVLMIFFVIAIFSLASWTILELMQRPDIKDQVQGIEHSVAKSVNDNDWIKALFVGGFNVLIPMYFGINMLRQRIRWCRGTAEKRTLLSKKTREVFETMKDWYWVGILRKICVLGEIYFTLQVGVSKLTYVFLSFMNEELDAYGISFFAVVGVAFVVGVLMFVLLPPLPGVAVYLFCGVVTALQGEEQYGFYTSCLIGVVLASACKIVGSTCQYGIGLVAGRNVFVQQQMGVQTVQMRAVEQILKRPGMNPGKIFVLVGGPDWPVSVLCGVMKINLPQVILGTLPIVAVLAPTVFAGGFMTQEDAVSKMGAKACMGVTAFVQPLSTFLALNEMTKVIHRDGEKLKKSRKEHEQVEKLAKRAEEEQAIYEERTRWNKLYFCEKVVIVAAAGLTFFSCTVFAAVGNALCFRPFTVSASINDPIADGGLGKDWLNIVRKPFGWMMLAVFFVGVFLHICFVKETQMRIGRGDGLSRISNGSAENTETQSEYEGSDEVCSEEDEFSS